MKTKVILNPYSARWSSGRRRGLAEHALQAAGVQFDLAQTERPGHAIELAASAVREGYETIVSAGGDGTIGEVVTGMMQAAQGKPLPKLGILALGTANDLAVNTGLPRDLLPAAKVIAAGHTRLIDVGRINDKYFLNNAGLGLEPHITMIQERMKRVHGILRYLLAALVGISHNPQWKMYITWDDGHYSGPATIVSISNAPLTGGIFYTVPHADPFDGRLTFVHGHVPTRLKILRLLPRTMKPGKGSYVEHPDVHEYHTTKLRVTTEPETAAHADGELLSTSLREIEFSIYPAALPLLSPAPKS